MIIAVMNVIYAIAYRSLKKSGLQRGLNTWPRDTGATHRIQIFSYSKCDLYWPLNNFHPVLLHSVHLPMLYRMQTTSCELLSDFHNMPPLREPILRKIKSNIVLGLALYCSFVIIINNIAPAGRNPWRKLPYWSQCRNRES